MDCQSQKNTEYVFADIVKRLMEARNLRYEHEVAELLGFTRSAFTERKRRKAVPMKELVTFCEREGIDLNWVLTGEEKGFIVAEDRAMYGAQHPDPEIQAVISMMESMDRDAKKGIRLGVEKGGGC